ncbi:MULTISPECIES: metal-dependent transcriptional regulator [Dietzia]|uniref:Iron dependent repressor, metal binding and dimerization domain protein n=2 Tax=Dietzia TaxID=37914 RepID=A0A365PED9_9ACTN|nr:MULTISPECIES: metal-dependent transcriptional regulator [Dietzia]MBB1017989.1 metal-dependent transcriptional regulator [Dietzia sp. DQ11-71]MVZ89615.1 dihydrofolate reductase [Microbacter sp. ANSKLAB05]ODQ83743.1 dihydrofolate reductase [Dietzia alimentaria]HBD21379.1 metal-dependent transcriptional regulator [Dietzia sp.]MBB1010772.1 metal-dependent transcriptional regulator [Dietzia kunjamensis]
MKDLVDTTEMYLRTIYELEEEGVIPLRARIAERLEQSGPTVSQTVARMERDGLVLVAPDRHLQLTATGRELAVGVMRKHRLAERLLVDVIGLELEKVHAEACRWEHVMSDDVERRLIEVLDDPRTSPYGNPIPGLERIGYPASALDDPNQIRLSALESDVAHRVRIRAIGENVQIDTELISELRAAGVEPLRTVTATRRGHLVELDSGEGRTVELDGDHAHAIQVEIVS